MHALQIIDQNILRLDISMYDITLLTIEESFNYLSNNDFCCSLIELFDSSQSLEQVSALAVFENRVNILVVIKITV